MLTAAFLIVSIAAWRVHVVNAQSESDELTPKSGLLGLASLLPAARYGTVHLAQVVGPRLTFLNPFLNGWFLGAYNGLLHGKPTQSEFGMVTASVSGAEIAVSSPFVFDAISSFESDPRGDEAGNLREEGLGWKITVVAVGGIASPRLARFVIVLFTLLVIAVPIVASYVVRNYSGCGSIAYVSFGLAMRAVENLTYVSIPPRPTPRDTRMGLLHKSPAAPAVVLLHADENDDNPVNIEDLAHPLMGVRTPRHGTLGAFTYRVLVGALLAGWLGFLVASSRLRDRYTNGYIELATMAVSALGELMMQQLVVGAMRVRTVRKVNAITAIAWLAHRRLLDAPGVPTKLLKLDEDEVRLVCALYRGQDNEMLWGVVRRCGRWQVYEEGDGPRR